MLSAFKNFAVTMLIALVIFGFGAYFASMFVTSTMNSILSSEKEQLDDIFQHENDSNPVEGDDPNTPVNPDDLLEGESFNLLLVITDYRPDLYGNYMTAVQSEESDPEEEKNPYDSLGYLSADYRQHGACAIVLICADREDKSYTYTYFSPESRLYTPAGYHTLGEAYSYYGADILKEHIHALTGIMPDYHITVNGYNLDEVVGLLGTVQVSLTKDIYFDGIDYTTRYEITREAIDEDGEVYTEHIPNTYTMGSGFVELDEEKIYILSSLKERSMADITMKEAYTVDIIKQYLGRIGAMEEEERRILISKLTVHEDDWDNIEGLETEAADPDEIIIPPSEDNPWWSAESITPVETEPETAAPEETTEDETASETEEPEETVYLFEPETPVFETSLSAATLEKIDGVLAAVGLFDQVTVSYPGKYVDATEDHGAYFDLNTNSGLSQFLGFRTKKAAGLGR